MTKDKVDLANEIIKQINSLRSTIEEYEFFVCGDSSNVDLFLGSKIRDRYGNGWKSATRVSVSESFLVAAIKESIMTMKIKKRQLEMELEAL